MTLDADGYGARPNQSEVERLLEDSRTLGESGIERIAGAWDAERPPGGARQCRTTTTTPPVATVRGRMPSGPRLLSSNGQTECESGMSCAIASST